MLYLGLSISKILNHLRATSLTSFNKSRKPHILVILFPDLTELKNESGRPVKKVGAIMIKNLF